MSKLYINSSLLIISHNHCITSPILPSYTLPQFPHHYTISLSQYFLLLQDLHYITLHHSYITIHHITSLLHHITSHYITLTSHYITLHYITLTSQYITLTSQYITLTSHYITLTSHYITLTSCPFHHHIPSPTSPLTISPGHLNTKCGFIPSCLAAMAVALAWLDWMLPQVMTLSQPRCRASARRNSSLRIYSGSSVVLVRCLYF